MREYSRQLTFHLDSPRKDGEVLRYKWNKRGRLAEESLAYYLDENIPQMKDDPDSKRPNYARCWKRANPDSDAEYNVIESLKALDAKSRIYIVGHGSAGQDFISSGDNNYSVSAYELAQLLGNSLDVNKLKDNSRLKRKLRISLVMCFGASTSFDAVKNQEQILPDSCSFAVTFLKFLNRINPNIECEVIARRLTVGFARTLKITEINSRTIDPRTWHDFLKPQHHQKASKFVFSFDRNKKIICEDDYEYSRIDLEESILCDLKALSYSLINSKLPFDKEKASEINKLSDIIKEISYEDTIRRLKEIKKFFKMMMSQGIINTHKKSYYFGKTSVFKELERLYQQLERAVTYDLPFAPTYY